MGSVRENSSPQRRQITESPRPQSSTVRRMKSFRPSSVSPKKTPSKQPLQIRMNLTESQMDKITDSFTAKIQAFAVEQDLPKGSTSIIRDSVSSAPASGTTSSHTSTSPLGVSTRSTSYGRPANIAHRRQKTSPTPLQILSPSMGSSTLRRPPLERMDTLQSPLTSRVVKEDQQCLTEEGSMAHDSKLEVSPLDLPVRRASAGVPKRNDSLYNTHGHWAQIAATGFSPSSPTTHNLQRTASQREVTLEFKPSPSDNRSQVGRFTNLPAGSVPSPLFSPLSLYFRTQDLRHVKLGQKILIGKNGWLERPDESLASDRKASPAKHRNGIFDSIRKVARDITDLNPHKRAQSMSKFANVSHTPISLDTREQSLLYCELEYHLTGSLNDFIALELEKGHLIPDNFKRIADRWSQQGRARVVGFRFDLETQIDLILLHLNEFSFTGIRQGQPSEIARVLGQMKSNAREMRIRTFCQPDSTVERHLTDAQALFETIQISEAAKTAMAEIINFFQAIVEREHTKRR